MTNDPNKRTLELMANDPTMSFSDAQEQALKERAPVHVSRPTTHDFRDDALTLVHELGLDSTTAMTFAIKCRDRGVSASALARHADLLRRSGLDEETAVAEAFDVCMRARANPQLRASVQAGDFSRKGGAV